MKLKSTMQVKTNRASFIINEKCLFKNYKQFRADSLQIVLLPFLIYVKCRVTTSGVNCYINKNGLN